MTDSSPADSPLPSHSQSWLFEDLSSAEDQTAPSNAKSSPAGRGVPRVKRPVRDQIEFREVCLDELVSSHDPVRAVWAFVMAQDLSSLYDKIAAVEGIGSAREIIRRTERDNPFR